jgi:glycosyltransferase involved in cell wall biosynthesis
MPRHKKRIPHILIASHVVFLRGNEVHGPSHSISQYLLLNKIEHSFIKHSLYNTDRSLIEHKGIKKTSGRESRLPRTGAFRYFQYIWELFTTLHYIARHPKVDIFIGIDPLNAIAGLCAKMVGKVDVLIFYTADYAYQRFDNTITNTIYHFLDKISYSSADYVWNVSSRITSIRKQQGVPTEKNRFIPNSPILQLMEKAPHLKKIPTSLVLIANFTPAIRYDLVVHASKKLVRKLPNLHVSFVGSGEREEAIKKLVIKNRLKKNFTFYGYQPHEKAIEILAKHEIGLALYDNKWPWTAFGDSLKAREYLALGLPVIINDHISTADDIEGFDAGYSIKLTEKKLVDCLTEVFGNKKRLTELQKNAYKAAKTYDLEKILDRELLSLIQSKL